MVRVLVLATILLAGVAGPLLGQACTLLPLETNELWFGASSWHGGESPEGSGEVEFSVVDRISVSASAGLGGRAVENAPSFSRAQVGFLARLGGWDTCLYGRSFNREYVFRDRYEVDRGHAVAEAYGFGLETRRELWRRGPVRLFLTTSLGASHSTWTLDGRRLLVTDSVFVEEVRRIERDWRVVGQGRVLVRLGRFGVGVALERRSIFEEGWVGSIGVGMAALRLPDS